MSKPVKQMMIDWYRQHLSDLDGAVLVDIRGVKSKDNNDLRSQLNQQGIKVTVVKNSLAKAAFRETGLEPLNGLLDGPSALVYGGESVVNVARELVDWAKKLQQLELKGAVMEGTVFGPDQVETLSNYPTREEAQAQVIQVILGPGSQVVGAATAAGGNIAGVLKTMIEKLENGEEIKKAG